MFKRSIDQKSAIIDEPNPKKKKLSKTADKSTTNAASEQMRAFCDLRDKIQKNVGICEQRSILLENNQFVPNSHADVS